MQIACPNCATSYRIVPSALGAEGRTVRCARCLTVWFANAPEPEPALATAGPAESTAAVIREEVVTDRPSVPQNPPIADNASQADAADDMDKITGADTDIPSGAAPAGGGPEEPYAVAEGEAAAIQAPTGWEASADAGAAAGDALPVTDAPPVAPDGEEAGHDHTADPPPAYEPIDDSEIESFAARRLQRQRMRKRNPFASPGLPSVILVLIAVVGGLLIWRKDIVRLVPQTASFYAAIGIDTNLRGLTFADIKTIREMQDGIPVLVVEGRIISIAPRPVEVPRIKLAVRGSAGQELYSWTALPPRSILPPGESLTFVSRLASPPTEAREVMVRFFNRRDAASGAR